MVLGLSLDIACKYVVERPEQGKILMNLLTPIHISKILNKLPEQQAGLVTANSLDCDLLKITDNFAAFKQDLISFIAQQKRKKSPSVCSVPGAYRRAEESRRQKRNFVLFAAKSPIALNPPVPPVRVRDLKNGHRRPAWSIAWRVATSVYWT